MKCFTFLCLLLTFSGFSQDKKIVDPSIYNDWKRLASTKQSTTGKYISYEILPHRGDGFLYLYDTQNHKVDSIFRASDANFHEGEKYWVYKKNPGFDTLRKVELDKVDKKKWPKDTLIIVRFSDQKTFEIPKVKSYKISPEGDFMAYLVDSTIADVKTPEVKKGFFKRLFKGKKKDPVVKLSSKGQFLYLFNPLDGQKTAFQNVLDYSFGDSGQVLILTTHLKKGEKEARDIRVYNLADGKMMFQDTSATDFGKYKFNPRKQTLAYFKSSDTTEVKNYSLHLFDCRDGKAYPFLDSNSAFMPKGFMPNNKGALYFSDDDRFLFLEVAEALEYPGKDTLLEREKPKLDLWHYEDKRLQPEQLLNQSKDRDRGWFSLMRMSDFHLTVLENDSMIVRVPSEVEGDYALGVNIMPYQQTYNWTFPNLEDHYRVELETGRKELILKGVGMGGDLSPSGQYFTFFNLADEQHYLMDISDKSSSCITCERKDVNWQTDVNGMPHIAFPYGTRGYDRGENVLYLQSEYDVWTYDISNQRLKSITNEFGRKENIQLTFQKWDRDSVYVNLENHYLKGFDKVSKDEMIFTYNSNNQEFERVYQTAHAIGTVEKDESNNQILLRKSSLDLYPELFLLTPDFKQEKRLTVTNPEQSDYNWAKVELMDYTSRDGQKLQALVYRPENFSVDSTYPLLVYFYELYTDEIHNHYTPRPTASIIYPVEYASAGYVVMIPDIRYKTGYPAQSAYDCIMGATDDVLKKYPNIDSTRMGLQGQSWGGYQTAQLVTMTTRYRAAMAGAPVANMFSAYGGIRWGSGLNRQFQYERTQSRIGKTIWEAPELYIENSPLFHLPKVTTPLLIMHNDGDGAVPWYQGIELFTGLKRLGKTTWLLNYNDDDHNLLKNANRMDLSIRMRQFFDHYLQNKPAPKWMIEGIPATDKGRKLNYELIEPQ